MICYKRDIVINSDQHSYRRLPALQKQNDKIANITKSVCTKKAK